MQHLLNVSAAAESLAASAAESLRLVVFTLFFGPWPPWLPLTLHSMAANPRVDFVIIGDAARPAVAPRNVRFETISFLDMQKRAAQLLPQSDQHLVDYGDVHYKANDLKPFVAHLFPDRLKGHSWWAWADLDVIFGDLITSMSYAMRFPACCRSDNFKGKSGELTQKNNLKSNAYTAHGKYCPCTKGEQVNLITPYFPNFFSRKTWGPFTALSANLSRAFERSTLWQRVLTTKTYTHFDEWWGKHADKKWMLFGFVLNRMAEGEGTVVTSAAKFGYGESRACMNYDISNPCGALRLRMLLQRDRFAMSVNGRPDIFLLHLSSSKPAWFDPSVRLPVWAPPEANSPLWSASCLELDGLGQLNSTIAAAMGEDEVRRLTVLSRHRVKSLKMAKHIQFLGDPVDGAGNPPSVTLRPTLRPCIAAQEEKEDAKAWRFWNETWWAKPNCHPKIEEADLKAAQAKCESIADCVAITKSLKAGDKWVGRSSSMRLDGMPGYVALQKPFTMLSKRMIRKTGVTKVQMPDKKIRKRRVVKAAAAASEAAPMPARAVFARRPAILFGGRPVRTSASSTQREELAALTAEVQRLREENALLQGGDPPPRAGVG